MPGERGAAGARAGGVELGARAAGEQAHAVAVGEVECVAQRRAGVGAAVGAAQRGAEIDERARVLELRRRVGEQAYRAFEPLDALVGIAGVRERAQAGSVGSCRAEALGELEVLHRPAARAWGVSSRAMSAWASSTRQEASAGLRTSSWCQRAAAAWRSAWASAGRCWASRSRARLCSSRGALEGAARRLVELAGGGERGVGGVELVGFGEGVDEWVQRPQQSGRRAVGQLEVEREAGVGLRLADAAGAHERHGPQEAAVSERDQPAARAREIDERGAARGRGLEVVVGDEHDGGGGGQQRVETRGRARRRRAAARAARGRRRRVSRRAWPAWRR